MWTTIAISLAAAFVGFLIYCDAYVRTDYYDGDDGFLEDDFEREEGWDG
jgi:hypothetical protein